MYFQSLEYLIFLPIVFVLYWGICRKNKSLQNGLIVVASLIFYGWWDWKFLGLLLLTSFSTFVAGWWMDDSNISNRKRKAILICCIILNIGVLFFFKYYNFFLQAFIDAFSLFGVEISFSTLQILLPVGISFYTLTSLSYVIDIYNHKIRSTKDVLSYLAYVMFFPSILSGPISRADRQLQQYYQTREFNYNNAVAACKMILLGGVMKLCLADRLGIYVDSIYANINQHNGTTLFYTSILYTIQIYADFAGYSLLAMGSGKLFGIELQSNFVRPYFALTITDFWRRWHISLTTWLRDYIYFPLGGNRCSKSRWILNTLIVFTISGLWHGAAYTFLIWGLLHGIFMVIERLVYGDKIKSLSKKFSFANLGRLILTFMIVNFAWIFFRVNNLNDVIIIFRKIFTEPGTLFVDVDTLFYAFLFTTLIFAIEFTEEYYCGKIKLMNSKYIVIRWMSYVAMIAMILLFGVLDGGSFIYFQF